MAEDCSFVAPGHLPSKWHRPQDYPHEQRGFHPPQPYQRKAQTYQNNHSQAYQNNNSQAYQNNNSQAYQNNTSQAYRNNNSQAYQNNTWAHQTNGQGHHNNAQAYQPQETYACGPCNRTYYSQHQLDKHLQDHVKCPFPKCPMSAHPKTIERHIDNQHLLVNFANLQIDDEAWIAERKKRFPTSQRAELRRAQQLQKVKRGERLGKSTKPFAPRGGRGGRGRGRGRGRGNAGSGGGGGGGDDDGGVGGEKNERKRPDHSESNDYRGRKKRRMMQDSRKDQLEEVNESGERKLLPTASHPVRQRRDRTDAITVPDPDSEDEDTRDGIPTFRGTRHFYESTGEVSYFGTKSATALESHIKEEKVKAMEQAVVNDISDEDDWDESGSKENSVGAPTLQPATLVLGGALGNLMGAYSDSEEDGNTTESASKEVKQSSSQNQTEPISNPALEHGRTKNESNGRKAAAKATMTTMTTQMPPNNKTSRYQKKKKFPKNRNQRGPKHPGGPRSYFPKRRKTLLERLLLPDITRERNIILQCARFIVQQKFFLPTQSKEEEKDEMEGGDKKDSQKVGGQKRTVEGEKESLGEEERLGGSHENSLEGKEMNQRENKDEEGKEKNQNRKDEEKETMMTEGEGEVEMIVEEDVAAGPHETSANRGTREVTAAVVRSAWAAAQEWTGAWKVGSSQLRTVVDGLEGLEAACAPEKTVHEAAKGVHAALVKMRGCLATLAGLLEELKKVEELEKKKEGGGAPLFSTLTLHHMVLILASVSSDYERETRVKEAACHPLPSARSPAALATSHALWTHLVYLPPQHYPLKTLLRETQQL
ncbi:Nuclear fragile X mental retardation-interacting protein 1 [Chionoecetes opilio]|uniref:Nuclear fragile X mental retardation-interacting protein 1 n=1 Tax=Chionoecetes opilio TaxID=41210 RepID=A0A8J4YHZ0_CHIOP|nr:Nuclear fragile X mental retardation-interacting protein 1 [Chionoecetes opilio]